MTPTVGCMPSKGYYPVDGGLNVVACPVMRWKSTGITSPPSIRSDRMVFNSLRVGGRP